jgi:serine/threonine protein kinase/tetratricopeptide (TPR) repeat protein
MTAPEIDSLINDRYFIKSEIGHGGMGKVYLAHDTLLERLVAIKFLSKAELGTEGRTRLLHEAQAIAQLNHPNIVTVYDAGQIETIPYIVMEFVDGKNLHETPLQEVGEVLHLTKQVCAALEHAHKNGIIHRDLKPENVLVAPDGTAKLMDFGLARSMTSRYTVEGTIIGTVFYLAPEFALGKNYDGRADLYALGIMLYELTTGELPFKETDPLAVISQHLHAPVVPPRARNEKIPPLLENLILRLLQKDPDDRPASASEVLGVLSSPNILDQEAVIGSEPTVLERIVRGRLIGREKELEQARSLWKTTLSGEAQLLLISGEPGIGKTRLLREMTTHAEVSGAWALVGESRFGSSAPYDAFTHILHQGLERSITAGIEISEFVLADLLTLTPEFRTVFGDITNNPALDPESEQRRLMENVSSFIQSLSEEIPLLLAIDDAHWADSGTLAMLQHLVRRCQRHHVMILITYREVELDEALPFHETMLALTRDGSPSRLKLSRLNRTQTGHLLGTIFSEEITPEFSDAIYQETEGNPFFIEEVCKALVEGGNVYFEGGRWHRPDMDELEIPQSIRVAIQSRVGRLPEEHQEVLRLAALLGREFDFTVLLEASGSDEEVLITALEEAEKAQLIHEVIQKKDVTFRFSHALFPTTLSEGIRTLRRRKLHMRIAQAVEKIRPNDFESLAFHYGEAGNSEKALNYFTKAGERASNAFANREAEGFFLSALDLAEESLERATLLTHLGIVQDRLGSHEKSIQSWLKSIELYSSLGKMDQVAELYALCGRASWEKGDTPGNLAFCLEGLRMIGETYEGPGTARLLAETGRAHYFNSQLDEVEPLCRRALEMAEKHAVFDAQADALVTLGILPQIKAEEAVLLFEKAIQLTEDSGYWTAASRAHNNLAVILSYRLGDTKASLEHLQKAAELAHKMGSVSHELFYESAATGWLYSRGDFKRAEDNLAKLYALSELADDSQYAINLLRMVEADLLKFHGELEKSILIYKQLHKDALSTEDRQAIASTKCLLSEALIEMGKFEEAKPILEDAIPLGDVGALPGGVLPRTMLAFIYAREGDFSTAHQLLEEAHRKYIEQGSRAFDELRLKSGQTRVAFLEKKWDEAWETAEATLNLMEKADLRWYRAYLFLDWGKACLQRGREEDIQQAESHFHEAASEFTAMGITHYAKQAQELLRSTQATTS